MFLSHNILVPDKTVQLSPFAVARGPGQICGAVKSATRALHALEVIAAAERPLRAIEIARSLNIRPSSANQLLKTLVDAAYLIFDPDSKYYYPSPRIINLGEPRQQSYFHAVKRLMADLSEALDWRYTTCLAASQGSFMQVIHVQRAPDEISALQSTLLDSRIGDRRPLFGSSVGAAWLSSQSEAKIRSAMRLCRRELGREADNIGPILQRMRSINRQGYAFGGLSHDDSIRSISMPLPPSLDGMVLVLAVSGDADEIGWAQKEIADTMKGWIRRHVGTRTIHAATSVSDEVSIDEFGSSQDIRRQDA
jgi:DNA-binding IclR family transcriptional regulator